MPQNKLKDDNLSNISGGVKTGEFDENGKVYITFPSFVSYLSGYYDVDGIESLANENYKLKGIIRLYITKEIKNAVSELYKRSNMEMSSTVKEVLGIN